MSKFQNIERAPLKGETAAEYARRLTSMGVLPVPLIKSVRRQYGLDIAAARQLVVTPDELAIFFNALKQRGVTRDGMVRLVMEVYGSTREEAVSAVDGRELSA